jgi:hypothetical protein
VAPIRTTSAGVPIIPQLHFPNQTFTSSSLSPSNSMGHSSSAPSLLSTSVPSTSTRLSNSNSSPAIAIRNSSPRQTSSTSTTPSPRGDGSLTYSPRLGTSSSGMPSMTTVSSGMFSVSSGLSVELLSDQRYGIAFGTKVSHSFDNFTKLIPHFHLIERCLYPSM